MGFDTWFGFDLIQRKTLEKKLAEIGGGGGLPGTTNFSDWAASQILFTQAVGDDSLPIWLNVDMVTAVSGAVQSWLGQLDGFGPEQILAVNAAGTGFEWISPPAP